MIEVIKANSKQETGVIAAEFFKDQIARKPDSLFGLATGETPIPLYNRLSALNAAGEVDFSRVVTVNLDEYAGLSEQNPQSYRYFMNHQLFDRVNIQKENTHLPQGSSADLAGACRAYTALLASLGTRDIQLLGIGRDGHIGFVEPAEALCPVTSVIALTESTIEANARFFDAASQVPRSALSMGVAQIFDAHHILLIASGKEKHEILQKALEGGVSTYVPASLLQLHPHVTVIDATETDL